MRPTSRAPTREAFARPDLDEYAFNLEITLRDRAAAVLTPRPLTRAPWTEEPEVAKPPGSLPSSPRENMSLRSKRKTAKPLREPTLIRDQRDNVVFGHPFGIWGLPTTKMTGFDGGVSPRLTSPRSKASTASAVDAVADATAEVPSGAAPAIVAKPTMGIAPAAAPEVSGDGLARLTSASALYEALRPPSNGKPTPTRLLRVSWFLERAEAMREARGLSQAKEADRAYRRYQMNTLALPRRQELPEEAFISGTELTELQPHGFVSENRLAVFAVSYAWRSAEHPDPEGESMVSLADTLLSMRSKRERGVWGFDQFPSEAGLFWDWASLLQPNPMTARRTALEQKAFEASLDDLELWFAHQLTTVFILSTSALLSDAGYFHRGWPLFESLVARLLKQYRADLWDPVIDVGDRTRSHHMPPLSLEDFASRIKEAHFALPSDEPTVLRLYENIVLKTLTHTQALAFERCRWGDHELRQLARVLPLCSRLRSLTLLDNAVGGNGLTDFCHCVVASSSHAPALPSLRVLNLSGNGFGDASVPDGGAHPMQLLAWAVSPFKLADVVAAEERHEELSSRVRNAGLPQLQNLTMDACRLNARTFLLFCRALMPTALANLVRLSVDNNDLEMTGIDPLVEALDTGAMPHLRTVIGVGGNGFLGSEVTSLRQAKRTRDKLSRIDWSKSNAADKLGQADKGFYGQELQDINRIDARLKAAEHNLERWRQRQQQEP